MLTFVELFLWKEMIVVNYIVPAIDAESFTCPYCNTLSQQNWNIICLGKFGNGTSFDEISFSNMRVYPETVRISISTCQSCKKWHVWIGDKMFLPRETNIPMPLDDMPEDIKSLYNEARDVFPHSKRATAALLRLALQKLCIYLGEKGKNINDDIASLVSKGLPIQVQKALDYVRITGNNSVHPGEMNIEDNDDICLRLFSMLNFVVDRMIVQPKEIEKAFDFLPEKAKAAIEKRDNK